MKIPIKDAPGTYINFRPKRYKRMILGLLYPSFVYEYEERAYHLLMKQDKFVYLYYYRPGYKAVGYNMMLIDDPIEKLFDNLYEFATRWSNWWPYFMQQNKHYRSLV